MNSFLTEPAPLSWQTVLLNLSLGIVLATVLAALYVRYGQAMTNRKLLARNFLLITLTTTLIISIVKASLALSLGLVGALSIVRFRAAIKEPEELAYLFLCIAIGLGLGADQRIVTTIAFGFIALAVVILSLRQKLDRDQNLFVNFETSEDEGRDSLNRVIEVLRSRAQSVDLRRVDTRGKNLQATFMIAVSDPTALDTVLAELRQIKPDASITFVEQARQLDV